MIDVNDFGCEPMALDSIKRLGLWMTCATLSRELRALDHMNNSGLWMI